MRANAMYKLIAKEERDRYFADDPHRQPLVYWPPFDASSTAPDGRVPEIDRYQYEGTPQECVACRILIRPPFAEEHQLSIHHIDKERIRFASGVTVESVRLGEMDIELRVDALLATVRIETHAHIHRQRQP